MDVLFDLTPMDTRSRFRGIGRYAYELGRALAAEHPGDLSIAGLVAPAGPASTATIPQPVYAGRKDLSPDRAVDQRMARHRRLRLASTVHRTGARLLHLTEARGTPIGLRVPHVVTCHDLIPLIFPKQYLGPFGIQRELHRRIELRRYRRARRVIAISETTRRDLTRLLDVDARRIDVIHHGIDHGQYQPEQQPTDADVVMNLRRSDRPYVMCIGGGDPRKNLEHLVAAFAASNCHRNVDLVFVGKLAGAKATLEQVASSAGVRRQIQFLGYVEAQAIPALYRRCLAHAFPTLYEGFGFPALEAMACGAPTVTTKRASLSEVIGDAAIHIGGDDVEETAKALHCVVHDGHTRQRLSRAGITAAARFTWQACARRTIDCYRRALAEN